MVQSKVRRKALLPSELDRACEAVAALPSPGRFSPAVLQRRVNTWLLTCSTAWPAQGASRANWGRGSGMRCEGGELSPPSQTPARSPGLSYLCRAGGRLPTGESSGRAAGHTAGSTQIGRRGGAGRRFADDRAPQQTHAGEMSSLSSQEFSARETRAAPGFKCSWRVGEASRRGRRERMLLGGWCRLQEMGFAAALPEEGRCACGVRPSGPDPRMG